MIVTIVALTPLFRDLPEAVLAAVVIVAVARLLMVRELRRYRRLRSADLVLAVVALLGVLVFGILPGLGGAVALSLVFLIYRSSRPNGAVLGRVPGERTYSDVSRHPENEQFPGLLIFRVDGQLFFANAALVQDRVRDLVAEQRPRALVMDMEVSTDLDITSADMLSELVSELHEVRVSVLFARVRDPVLDMFRRSGLLHKVNAACVFPTVDDAVRSFLAGDAPLRPVSPPGAVTGHMEREPGE
jgi:MFS superfamily sulfate permease-like transporter